MLGVNLYLAFLCYIIYVVILNMLKQIPNTNNIYYADADGNIYNYKKEKKKCHSDKDGYLITSIDGKSKKVHRLILETFIINKNNYPMVNHINGIKNDNRLCNLEWVSASQNVYKAHHETKTRVAGVNTGMKAIPVICIEILTNVMYNFDSISGASRALKIPEYMISRCVNGKRKSAKGFIFKKKEN